MGGCDLGIRRELPLERENGRYALFPERLRGGEDAQLVVDEHVTHRRVAPLDVVELELLVDVDEDVPVDCAPDSGPLDLVRLEDGVAVREDDRRPEHAQVRQYLQRRGVEAIRERVAEEIARTRRAGADPDPPPPTTPAPRRGSRGSRARRTAAPEYPSTAP